MQVQTESAISHTHSTSHFNVYIASVMLSDSSRSAAAQKNCWVEGWRPFWDFDQSEEIKLNWPYHVKLLTSFRAVVLWLQLALIRCWPTSSCPRGIKGGNVQANHKKRYLLSHGNGLTWPEVSALHHGFLSDCIDIIASLISSSAFSLSCSPFHRNCTRDLTELVDEEIKWQKVILWKEER